MENNCNYFSTSAKTYEKEIHDKSIGTQYLSELEKKFITTCLANYSVAGQRCLELGAGSGRITDLLLYAGLKVTVIEKAAGMLKILREKYHDKTVTIRAGDAGNNFLFDNKTFGLIVAMRVLKYLPGWQDTILEVKRTLKKRGVFIFSVSNLYSVAYFKGNVAYSLFNPKEVMSYLQQVGFEVLEMSPTSRLPFPFYVNLRHKAILNIAIAIENLFSKIMPYWLFSRAILICVRLK